MNLVARDAIAFPAGDNATDTLIGGVHFNLTTLEHFNYTLYENNTVSNASRCFLAFEPYTPDLFLTNGSWVNGTSCYSPIKSTGTRGAVGIALAVVYGLCLVAVCVCLQKHGKIHLPVEKRFYPIGRRWQWYWAIFVCAAALISLFTGIDVDRYYLPEIPIVLNVFFWFLMQIGTTAVVWEAARHWGSWMERQYIDPDPFVLKDNDRRWLFELLWPIFFYFWAWLNFFLVIPRNWTPLEMQRSPQLTTELALPTATDGRFKAAAFCLLACWIVTVVSLRHSIFHYASRNPSFYGRTIGALRYLPFRFALLLILELAVIAYQALCAWDFAVSPLKIETNLVGMYVGGYAPSLLVLIVQIISGFARPNEDRELIRQRRKRGAALDRDLGIVKKPAWWRLVNGDLPPGSMRDRLMRNMREVGDGAATARNVEAAMEMRAAEVQTARAADPEPGTQANALRGANSATGILGTAGPKPPPPYTPYPGRAGSSEGRSPPPPPPIAAGSAPPPSELDEDHRPEANGRSNSTISGSTLAPPQQIRSMLDV